MAISNLSTLELRKQIEIKVEPILDWEPLELSILFKMLRAKGYTSEGLDYRIDHMLIMECATGQTIKRC